MRRVLLPFGLNRGLNIGLEGQLISGRGCITSLSIYETSGAAVAGAHLIDGASSNGQFLAEWTLPAGGSNTSQWGHHWLVFEDGLWIDVYAGAAAGTMTLWVDHDCGRWLEAAHLSHEATIALAAAGLPA